MAEWSHGRLVFIPKTPSGVFRMRNAECGMRSGANMEIWDAKAGVRNHPDVELGMHLPTPLQAHHGPDNVHTDAVRRVRNVECTHDNSAIGRSDAADKECENPFSPTTRQPRNKEGRQAPRAPRKAEHRKKTFATPRRETNSRFSINH